MALTRLLIRDFRNIKTADLTLDKQINFLLGANGSGKTSVLEAIYTLGHGRAFRSVQNDKVIRHGQTTFTLHGRVQWAEQTHHIGISKNRHGESQIRIDNSDGHTMAELAQQMPIQLITPEGFTLLNGGPKYRRAFLDWGCFHLNPEFFQRWHQLKRLLKQRNAALRQITQYQQIKVWDQQLIPLAQQISQWRAHYVQALLPNIQKTCSSFLPEYSLSFSFYQGWEREADYGEILMRQFERDRALTYTTLGPHKADFHLRIDHSNVEDRLSRGQLKLLMCALRLAQGEHLSHHRGRHCLYLIDDFASELDPYRRGLLAERLKATGAQVFVSAINIDQIQDMIDGNNKMFHLECGKISISNES